jgi:hypothetical protein
MNDPTWKLISSDVVWREWLDGRQESCLVTAEEYVKWLAEGNEPLPADEVSGE